MKLAKEMPPAANWLTSDDLWDSMRNLVKQPAFYYVFHTQRAKSRWATTNQGAYSEILSFSSLI